MIKPILITFLCSTALGMAGPLLDAPGPGYRQMSEAVVGRTPISSISHCSTNAPAEMKETIVLPVSEKPVSSTSPLLEGKGDFKLQLGNERVLR